jgi:NADH-quinone oxidoreductase subunit L
MIELTWLIPLFPFTGFLITGLFYKRLPVKIAGWFASLTVLMSFIISLMVFFELVDGAPSRTIIFNDWIRAGNTYLPVEFLIDQLTSLMLLVITGVGFLIHIYSIGYMHGDEGYNRFFSFMNLFVFFMTLLVLGGNYLIMFIGWEGVGFCSYLLIGFWNRNNEYNNAARKAFIMNRIGDLGFLLGMFLMYGVFGSLSYTVIFAKSALLQSGSVVVTIITLLLFIGATGKSAQIPLLTWLPDAMAGPTPVSALIHAATMVTAGVYLVARSNILYALSPLTMSVVAFTGIATAILAAVIALFQNDIKKVLAYSTISQLGLMFLALGTGAFAGAMFHLITHAFFKALLFLAAGSIMHALGREQDIRNMGGMQKKTPWTYLVFFTGALSISGIPPFSGFFSKDEILSGAYAENPVLWVLGVLVSIMTATYIFRVLWLTFHGEFRGNKVIKDAIFESPAVMLTPLFALAVLAAFGALPFVFQNIDRNSIASFLEPVFKNSEKFLSAGEPLATKSKVVLIIVSVLMIAFTIYVSWLIFVRRKHIPAVDAVKRKGFNKLAFNKFYIDEIYNFLFVSPLAKLSDFFTGITEPKLFDGIIEYFGRAVLLAGKNIRLLQTGNVGFYLFAMVIFIIIVLLFNVLR